MFNITPLISSNKILFCFQDFNRISQRYVEIAHSFNFGARKRKKNALSNTQLFKNATFLKHNFFEHTFENAANMATIKNWARIKKKSNATQKKKNNLKKRQHTKTFLRGSNRSEKVTSFQIFSTSNYVEFTCCWAWVFQTYTYNAVGARILWHTLKRRLWNTDC